MKTEQQKRFEAALRQVGYTAEYYFKADANNPDGYWDDFTQCRWEGFKLGESSGLALAAAICESELARNDGISCAEAIRALMTEGVKP